MDVRRKNFDALHQFIIECASEAPSISMSNSISQFERYTVYNKRGIVPFIDALCIATKSGNYEVQCLLTSQLSKTYHQYSFSVEDLAHIFNYVNAWVSGNQNDAVQYLKKTGIQESWSLIQA